MNKENKISISARLPQKTIDKINKVIKFSTLKSQSEAIEFAVNSMTESDTDRRIRKLYKESQKTMLALQSKKDLEELSIADSNIQETLWNLIEYIEAWQKQEDDH